MTKRLTAAFTLSLALITSACGSSMKTPDIKQNPTPKHRYEIMLSVSGVSSSLDAAEGYMQQQVTNNEECVPADPISGHVNDFAQYPNFALGRIGASSFKGELALDYYLDADYFGKGICHWAPMNVGIRFTLQGHPMHFSVALFPNELKKQQPVTRYIRLKFLEAKPGALSYDFDASVLTDEIKQHPGDFFAVTVSPKELTP